MSQQAMNLLKQSMQSFQLALSYSTGDQAQTAEIQGLMDKTRLKMNHNEMKRRTKHSKVFLQVIA